MCVCVWELSTRSLTGQIGNYLSCSFFFLFFHSTLLDFTPGMLPLLFFFFYANVNMHVYVHTHSNAAGGRLENACPFFLIIFEKKRAHLNGLEIKTKKKDEEFCFVLFWWRTKCYDGEHRQMKIANDTCFLPPTPPPPPGHQMFLRNTRIVWKWIGDFVSGDPKATRHNLLVL